MNAPQIDIFIVSTSKTFFSPDVNMVSIFAGRIAICLLHLRRSFIENSFMVVVADPVFALFQHQVDSIIWGFLALSIFSYKN